MIFSVIHNEAFTLVRRQKTPHFHTADDKFRKAIWGLKIKMNLVSWLENVSF